MRRNLWLTAVIVDVCVLLFCVLQFDVDGMFLQYIGAMVCAVMMFVLIIIGWNIIKELEQAIEDDDTLFTRVTDIDDWRR